MTYILILTIFFNTQFTAGNKGGEGAGVTVSMQEFNTLESCISAQKTFYKMKEPELGRNEYVVKDAECVPK